MIPQRLPAIVLLGIVIGCLSSFPLPGRCQTSVHVTTLAKVQCLHVVVNPTNGNILAACSTSGVLSIAPNGVITTLANSTACPKAVWVDLNANTGIAYAACQPGGVGNIISINGPVITNLTTPQNCILPMAVTVNPLNAQVLASCNNHPGGILAIGSDGGVASIANYSVCQGTGGIIVNENVVYASCAQGVVRVNGSAVSTLASASQCNLPAAVALNPHTGIVYAACSGNSPGIVSINGPIMITYPAGCAALDVAVNPSTSLVYGACGAIGLYSLVQISGSTTTALISSGGAGCVAVNPLNGAIIACVDTLVEITFTSSAIASAACSQLISLCLVFIVAASALSF